MLWIVAIAFTLLWVLGLATSHRLGGYIHVLAIVATVLFLVRIVQGSGQAPIRTSMQQTAQLERATPPVVGEATTKPRTLISWLGNLLFLGIAYFTAIALLGASVPLGIVATKAVQRTTRSVLLARQAVPDAPAVPVVEHAARAGGGAKTVEESRSLALSTRDLAREELTPLRTPREPRQPHGRRLMAHLRQLRGTTRFHGRRA